MDTKFCQITAKQKPWVNSLLTAKARFWRRLRPQSGPCILHTWHRQNVLPRIFTCARACTLLWCEAHLEVKMCKTHPRRTTFGGWDVEKVHAILVRSTFPSQNVQNTSCSDHFGSLLKLKYRKSARRCGGKHISNWKVLYTNWGFGALLEVEMLKKCTPLWREAHFEVKMNKAHQEHFWKLRCSKSVRHCGAKHISKSKCTKHTKSTFGSWDVQKVYVIVARSTFRSQNVQNNLSLGTFLEAQMSKKCTPLRHEAHFEVKSVKNWRSRTTFGRSDVALRGRRKGFCIFPKVSKTWGLCSMSENDGRRGLEEDLERCISRGRRSTKDMFIRDVRRSGRWFPERSLHFGASDLQVC